MFSHPNWSFCTDQIARTHVHFGLTCIFEKCSVLENSSRGTYVTLSYYGSDEVLWWSLSEVRWLHTWWTSLRWTTSWRKPLGTRTLPKLDTDYSRYRRRHSRVKSRLVTLENGLSHQFGVLGKVVCNG